MNQLTPTLIEQIEVIPVGPSPEDVLLDQDGSILTGLGDGRLIRRAADGSITTVAHTGGRPLGLDFLPDGRVLTCDTDLGLLAVTPSTGQIQTLVPRGAASLNLCNNPAVAADGRIFFSDSTQIHGVTEAKKDIIDAVPSGRLLCRHPDGRVEVLMQDLLFANGVVVASDQSFVLVAQTGRGCINRLWLTGERAGQTDLFTTEMPGLPDNLSIGSDGLIWVALVSPLSDLLRRIHRLPFLARYLIARLPERWQPEQPLFCRVAAYDPAGILVHLFEGDKATFNFVTGLRERHGTVFLGSIAGDSIAHFTLPGSRKHG